VPDAEVGMEQWGINRHDIEWRGRTDANGFLEWRSAPHDAVMELFARKDGYCYTRDVKLKADGQVHVIRLRHALMLFGRVVDAGTGALIPDFRAVPAYGGYGDRAERWFAGSTVRGTNGLFRLAFDDRDGPWHVRIIADGYEDWTSEPLEGEALTLDIPLKKALKDNSLRGIVLAPDGRPAAAQVALLTFEHNVSLTQKGRFEPRNKRWLTDSAADGSFSFPTNSMAHSLAVATAEGFALLRLAGAKPPVTIQLQPWGRVEGVVHPSAAAQGIDKIELFDPTAQNYQGHVSLLSHFSVRPDAAGRFAFERVPAGEFSAYVNSGSDINFHHQTPCAVRPGETTTVIITNGPGALVKGRLIAPLNRAFSWKDDCTLIHLYAEGRNLEFPPGTAADRRMREFEFWTSTAGRDYVNNTHVYSGRVSNEGTFVMLDPVRPGKYRFTAIFSPSGIPNLSITRHVTIPDQAVFDLGDLPLE
jgi:hypothetical protein